MKRAMFWCGIALLISSWVLMFLFLRAEQKHNFYSAFSYSAAGVWLMLMGKAK